MRKKKKVFHRVYERLGVVKVGEVVDFLPTKNNKKSTKKDFFGESVRLTSHRYRVYKKKGTICAQCDLEGTFFALEKSLAQTTKKYHFNLYGVDNHGQEIMITVDHIIPRAKGGLDTIDNKQPMCFICNNKKGDKLPNAT